MSGRGRGRGRGRGGRGGRGGGGRGGSRRGRSGFGRGRGRGRGAYNRNGREEQNDGPKKDINIKDDPKSFFTGTATVQQHYEAQEQDCGRYCATFFVLIKNGIKIAQNAKIRALAIALGRNDMSLVTAFLQTKSQFGLVEVLKAVTMLDAGRQVRILEKKLKSLELSSTKVRPHKLGQLKRDIHNTNKMKLPVGSASGAVCRHITKWVRGFSQEDLEFYAIHLPKDPWKKLADICHFNPKDFPAAPWFLPHCFDSGELPEGSIVKICAGITQENVNDIVRDNSISFSIVKQYKGDLNAASKKKIAAWEPSLDTVLWNYEDLRCPEVDEVIYQRLTRGDAVNLSNGKLLERLLTIAILLSRENESYIDNLDTEDNFFTRLIEVANPKLTSIRLPLESPIAILGDASPSMSVAIRTSTIIASLLTSICSAKLVFFDSVNMDAPFLPETVQEMLKLALTTKTKGSTIPAVSLYPFYERKEIIKTFIIVTDEEENGSHENYRFAPLFKKYHDEIYPATLVFVSFLGSQHAQGEMVSELNALGIHPKQLKLAGSRPDLTKLDDLFGQLSASTMSFSEEVLAAECEYKDNGAGKLFEKIKGASQLTTDEE